MSRLSYLKQRAAKRGIFVVRSFDNPSHWDLIDKYGPHGLQITKRTAINMATRATRQQVKVRVYIADSNNQWHRGTCEVVASRHVVAKACDCQRLVVN